MVIPVGLTGADIVFADGVRTLTFNQAAGEVRIGSQAVGTTAMVVNAAAGTATATGAIDPTLASLLALVGPAATVAGNVQIFGSAAAETVTVLPGTHAVFDPSFNIGGDTIVLPRIAAAYTAARSGSSVIFQSAGETVSIPVGFAGATIRFAGGYEGVLKFDPAAGAVTLGGQVIGATTAPFGLSADHGFGDIGTVAGLGIVI